MRPGCRRKLTTEKVSDWVGERKWLSIIDAQEKVREKVGGGYCKPDKPI